MTRRRWAWLFLTLGVVLILVWAGRLAATALSLRRHLAAVEALVRAPDKPDPSAACALVGSLRRDVETVRREAGGLVSLAPGLRWLPGVGGDLCAAPHLLEIADGLSEAGVIACDVLKPALDGPEGESFSLEQALYLLAEKGPDLQRAKEAIARAEAAWKRIEVSRLSPRLARRALLVGRMLPWLQDGLVLATAAPDLLGLNRPRIYLVIAQNEDERRPTGGYITGVGEVWVENGRVVSMTFRDSYAADDFSQPYPDPPAPMRRYMGIDLWVFRDSNWSPDFPTAARQAIALYRPGYTVLVDGVIAVDQYALQQLLAAVGPLTVEGTEGPVTAENVIPYIRRAWAPADGSLTGEWWQERKSFMGPLAEAFWKRVQEGNADWFRLAETLARLLDEKHLLVYLPHPAVAPLLAGRGWDGALQPGQGDFLMVVDANVGYNKASAKVQQSITYEVDLRRRPPQAALTLVYTHTSSVDYPCIPEFRYDPVYEQMMDRCYWDYLRVYIPQGSRLVDAPPVAVPGEALWWGEPESGEVAVYPAQEEGPWLSLETLLLVPPAAAQTRFFTWELPDGVVRWDGAEGIYTLRVQKQSGTAGHPLVVRVRLGEDMTLLTADPSPSVVDGSFIVFETRLDRDREFHLRFRRER